MIAYHWLGCTGFEKKKLRNLKSFSRFQDSVPYIWNMAESIPEESPENRTYDSTSTVTPPDAQKVEISCWN